MFKGKFKIYEYNILCPLLMYKFQKSKIWSLRSRALCRVIINRIKRISQLFEAEPTRELTFIQHLILYNKMEIKLHL